MTDPTAAECDGEGSVQTTLTDDYYVVENGVRVAPDSTQAVFSESSLDEKWLCDYVSNVAMGCRHKCRFCYVPTTAQTRFRQDVLEDLVDVENPQDEWGGYLLRRYPRKMARRLREKLARKRTWRDTERGRGVVGISYHTDCYQDAKTGATTRAVAREFFRRGVPVRIQTRNTSVALQDFDLYRKAAEHGLATVGTSLPSLDAEEARALEPRTLPPEHRLRCLSEFAEAGVFTFVSVSPTYPTQDKADLRALLEAVDEALPTLDVVFHEALNPRGRALRLSQAGANTAGADELRDALEPLADDTAQWLAYARQHLQWMVALRDELDLPVKLWPGDVVDESPSDETAEWRALKEEPTPEDFPVVDDPAPSDEPLAAFMEEVGSS